MAIRLSPLDATFLELEQSDQSAHMHIGAVMTFAGEPGESPPRLEDLQRHLEERLGELPRYRQRLSSPTTGGLQWPDWVDDRHFDIGAHVRRERLPAPGGEAELLDWAGEYFSQRLDRARPLWEAVLIEGLPEDRWAIATKTHHCMVDGVGSVDVGTMILDAEPHPAPRPRRGSATRRERPEDLGGAANGRTMTRALVGRSLGAARLGLRLATAPLRIARGGARVAADPQAAREALHSSRALAEVLVRDELIAAPHTSLNVRIGGKRRLAVASFSLQDLKDVRKELGGTVNDVILALASGGLRKLLEHRGETPPARPMRAMVPVNIRAASERLALGNRITSLFVHLPIDEADPLRRYRRQLKEAETLKSGSQALGSSMIVEFAGHAPPILHTFLARALFATRLFNVTITNVPGMQVPLYAFGARMTDVWPIVPLAAEHAVGIAVFSYDGKVFFTINADRNSMPDLDVLMGGIVDSLGELKTGRRKRVRRVSRSAKRPAGAGSRR